MTMLLPSFNFIRGKEIIKLLRNFHLAKVKQNFFLLGRGCSETEMNNQSNIYYKEELLFT